MTYVQVAEPGGGASCHRAADALGDLSDLAETVHYAAKVLFLRHVTTIVNPKMRLYCNLK